MDHSTLSRTSADSLATAYPPSNNDESKSEHFLVPQPEGPPPLRYDIASKKKSIAINWTIILLCNAIIPVPLYYALRFGTALDQVAVISITEITMTSSLISLPYRMWQLLRRSGERAPRDRTPWTLDNFQWQFLLGTVPVAALCIAASALGSIRLLTLAPVVLFAEVAAQLLLTTHLARLRVPIPFRMSSQPPGAPARPAVYFIIEDLTAVDGAGGAAFRARLDARYAASAPFRQLVHDLSLYLGAAFLALSAVHAALVAATPGDVSFGVSTALLWGSAGAAAWWGVWYSKRALTLEKVWWVYNLKKQAVEDAFA